MANFGLMQLCLIAYTLIKDMNYHCAKFDTNMSTNMDSTNIFQFLTIFAHNFYYFTKQIANFGTYSASNHG